MLVKNLVEKIGPRHYKGIMYLRFDFDDDVNKQYFDLTSDEDRLDLRRSLAEQIASELQDILKSYFKLGLSFASEYIENDEAAKNSVDVYEDDSKNQLFLSFLLYTEKEDSVSSDVFYKAVDNIIGKVLKI